MNTTNSVKYHFHDFTREAYRNCLKLAKEKYVFRTYTDFEKGEPFVLWRHDLDYSVHAARKLAQIEQEEGVRATYFLLAHSELYNLLEKEVFNLIKEIQGLGHSIGLHFDSHFHNISSAEQLDKALEKEKGLLENFFETEVNVFSFHNNNEFTMSCEEWEYGGMINTYAKFFKSEVGYCSDSNGIWRFSRLQDILEKAEHKKLQVLTHPEWWQEKPMAPRQKIMRCIDGRAAKTLNYYDDLLVSMQRPNIDDV